MCGTMQCQLGQSHKGYHQGSPGVNWEDNKKIRVKRIEHYISEGQISKHCDLYVEYIAEDGRRFYRREYQLHEIKEEPQKCKCDSVILLHDGCQCQNSLN